MVMEYLDTEFRYKAVLGLFPHKVSGDHLGRFRVIPINLISQENGGRSLISLFQRVVVLIIASTPSKTEAEQ